MSGSPRDYSALRDAQRVAGQSWDGSRTSQVSCRLTTKLNDGEMTCQHADAQALVCVLRWTPAAVHVMPNAARCSAVLGGDTPALG